jgi:hypothetical protein
MRTKKHIVIVLAAVIMLPFILAFNLAGEQQRRWWQRKKEVVPPMEFSTHTELTGQKLEITFKAGDRHNHPLMVFWITDTLGNYIQTLYVAKSIATGYFGHGDASEGYWQPGPLRRPATLPYWSHGRGVKAEDGLYLPSEKNPMPDAVTGPTPKADFVLTTTTSGEEPDVFRVYMEINQSWDWNQYWHNNRFPDDHEYKTSSQPAVVYMTTIEKNDPRELYIFEAIGHSHYAGADGKLYTTLETLTTALEITESVTLRLK